MNLDSFNKVNFIWLFVIAIIFLAVRIPALSTPYHQDEYKWPIIVNPALTDPGGIPHPPVGEFIYRTAGQTIGYDNFRVVPLVFSFLNLFLLFYLAKLIFNKGTALWATFLFAISFYSVLASLMVDTDGTIMPFFFLIMAIGYIKLKASSFELKADTWKWLGIIVLGAVLGFLVKVSFAVAIGALALDFTLSQRLLSAK